MALDLGAIQELKPPQLKEFSFEAKEALKKEGYKIYSPRAISLSTLQAEGMRFKHIDPVFKDTVSGLNSQIAINPDKMFLPNSFTDNPHEQVSMVDELNQNGSLPVETRAILADDPSLWGEIFHQYYEDTHYILLVGKYTIIKTSEGWAVFGHGAHDPGPFASKWLPTDKDEATFYALLLTGDIGVARLLVPT